MNSSQNSIDYVITKKKEGKYGVLQIILYIAYAAVLVGTIVGLAIPFKALGVVMGGVLGAMFMYILILATKTVCNFDLKYSIFTTNVTMDKVPETVISFEIVRDRKKLDPDKRNVVFEDAMKKAILFAPYTDEYKDKYAAADITKTIDFRSTVKATDVYFGIFPGKDGGKTVIIFEAVNKVVDKLKYFNKEATVVAPLSK